MRVRLRRVLVDQAAPVVNRAAAATSITVSWKAVTRATSYRVESRPASGGGAYTVAYNGTALSTTVSGLTSATQYDVRVTAAVNGAYTNPQVFRITTS